MIKLIKIKYKKRGDIRKRERQRKKRKRMITRDKGRERK